MSVYLIPVPLYTGVISQSVTPSTTIPCILVYIPCTLSVCKQDSPAQPTFSPQLTALHLLLHLPLHTATTHCHYTLPQQTATTHCHYTLPLHTATTNCHNTLPLHTATTHCHNKLPLHTATTHCPCTLPQQTATANCHYKLPLRAQETALTHSLAPIPLINLCSISIEWRWVG